MIRTHQQAATGKGGIKIRLGPCLRADHVLTDKACDSNALCGFIANMGAQAVIPCNRTRKKLIPYDFEIYKARNLIERCFNKLKHFRRIATRYDRRAKHFLAFIQLASAMLWMG